MSENVEEVFFDSTVDNECSGNAIELSDQTNSSSCSDEVEVIKVEQTQKLLKEDNYKIPQKKKKKMALGKSQSILHKFDQCNMVPLRPTTKGSQSRSLSITNRAPSSTSSKWSVESASFTHNYSDDLDDEIGREKQVLEKLSN